MEYYHLKSKLVVKLNAASDLYEAVEGTLLIRMPKEVVENSNEWKEIKPLIDFYGKAINENELHYRVILDTKEVTHVLNGKSGLWPEHAKILSKTLAIFKDYEEACDFQRVYCSLKKAADLLVTPGGNPSTYLKNVIALL
jgi:hypothetical protein